MATSRLNTQFNRLIRKLSVTVSLTFLLFLSHGNDCSALVIYENEHVHFNQGTFQQYFGSRNEYEGYYLAFARPFSDFWGGVGAFIGVSNGLQPHPYDSDDGTAVPYGTIYSISTNLSYEYDMFFTRPGALIAQGYDEEFDYHFTRVIGEERLGSAWWNAHLNYFENTEDIYIGFSTANNPEEPSSIRSSPRNIFGWARLEIVAPVDPLIMQLYEILPRDLFLLIYPDFQFKLRMVESVISYDSHGIYIGTTNAIPAPEPSSLFATFSALVAAPFLRCKRHLG